MRGPSPLVGAVGLVTALAVLGGCEPLPPPPVLTVTTEAEGADADPGDGVCEATPGVGDCTLRAALEQASALGRADVVVPAGRYLDHAEVVVTGDVRVNVGAPTSVEVDQLRLRVAAGASLHLDGVWAYAIGGPEVVVEGRLVAHHLSLVRLEGTGASIQVTPGGEAYLADSLLVEVFNPSAALDNDGTAVLLHTTLWSPGYSGTGPFPALSGDGTTGAASSILSRCTGAAPVSFGANADEDGSCSLSGPGDQPGIEVTFLTDLSGPVSYQLAAGSPLVDAVPVGTNGCGTGVVDDLLGSPRPVDGDGDLVPACDVGATERPG